MREVKTCDDPASQARFPSVNRYIAPTSQAAACTSRARDSMDIIDIMLSDTEHSID